MSLKTQLKKLLQINDDCKWYFDLKYGVLSLPYYLCRVFPIDRRKIVFSSFYGKYGSDPKILSDAMLDSSLDADLVWLLSDPTIPLDPRIRAVKKGSLREIFELATAKIWIDDCRKTGYVRKRPGQFYIGTGHGGIPMKKIEMDAEDKLTYAYKKTAVNDSAMTDLKPSNTQWRNDMLRRAFWYNGEILNCGLPRVEYLIKRKDTAKTQVRKKLRIPEGVRVFMYAPTFRNTYDEATYALDFAAVSQALSQRFGGQWIGIRRLHPNVKNYSKQNIPGVVIDGSDYPDMEELMLSSDLLISDYSSVVFETMFVDIPCFLFAVDLEDYRSRERGLYWDIAGLPYPIGQSNQELTDRILRFNQEDYSEKIAALKTEIGLFPDQTHAVEQLLERIRQEMKG